MSIIPTETKAFLSTKDSISASESVQIKKSFQTAYSSLLEYGALEFGSKYSIKTAPSPVAAVRPTKRPLIPMYIALIPPDEFPSGEFKTTRVSSPSDVTLTLIKSRTGNRKVRNVEGVRIASQLVASQNGYVISSPSQTVTLSSDLRTDSGQKASGNLPKTYTSSDESVATVSPSGEVSFLSLPNPAVTVTISTTNQARVTLTASVIFTSDPDFPIVDADPLTSSEGVRDTTTETLVSTSENLGEDFLESLKDRYLKVRTSGSKARIQFEDSLEDITKRRKEVVDIYAQRSEAMQERRNPAANEAFLKSQIALYKLLPPLMMYVNPSEFSVSYAHVLSDGNKGRNGNIIEHWGLEQPVISASGTIGAAYITSTKNGKATGGVTNKLRRGSASFQSFMSLYQAYRNNAYLYNYDKRIAMMGAVQIFYGETVYTGSFDSFSIQESEDSPYSLAYSFSFTVRFEDKILT